MSEDTEPTQEQVDELNRQAQDHVDHEEAHGRTVTLKEAAERIIGLAALVAEDPEAAEAAVTQIQRENHDQELLDLRLRVANLEEMGGAVVVGP